MIGRRTFTAGAALALTGSVAGPAPRAETRPLVVLTSYAG